MEDNSSIILFGSIAEPSSASANRFDDFSQTVQQEYRTPSSSHEPIDLVFSRDADDIFRKLEQYHSRIITFHFEGRSENYDMLLTLARKHHIRNLSEYLGKLRSLKFVFLSGCARDKYIKALLDRGVPAVVTSSKRLSNVEIALFAESVYEKLSKGNSLEDAFTFARQSLGIVESRRERINVNLRGVPQARRWKLLPNVIGTPSPHFVGEQNEIPQSNNLPFDNQHSTKTSAPSSLQGTIANPDAHQDESVQSDAIADSFSDETSVNLVATPKVENNARRKDVSTTNYQRQTTFVGIAPFSKNDGDIFFGRDTEIEKLIDWVVSPARHGIILSGVSGVGKTSLIQAGLLPQLEGLNKEYCIYQFSVAREQQLFGRLHDKLREDSGKEDPLEAWMYIECIKKHKILVIVDDIGAPFARPIPGQHEELPKLMAGLAPIFCDQTYSPKGKILLCVRDNKLRDVLQQCQHNGFVFEQFPLSRMGVDNLKAAIRKPFMFYSIEQAQVVDAVVDEVACEIQKDITYPDC